MAYSLIIKDEATLDIQDAYEYYEGQKPGLGSELVRSIDACLSKIGRYPKSYPVVYKEVRRALIRKFPYCIFYFTEGEALYVIACFHAKRDPKSWGDRKPSP